MHRLFAFVALVFAVPSRGRTMFVPCLRLALCVFALLIPRAALSAQSCVQRKRSVIDVLPPPQPAV
jgi:hypothetical protein